MTTTHTKARDEAQIRQLIDQWTQALHAKDLNTLMSYYAPDILTAYSGRKLPLIPVETCRRFQSKVATDSD
jgi:hypothetical protein